jgi:hypothetical protein
MYTAAFPFPTLRWRSNFLSEWACGGGGGATCTSSIHGTDKRVVVCGESSQKLPRSRRRRFPPGCKTNVEGTRRTTEGHKIGHFNTTPLYTTISSTSKAVIPNHRVRVLYVLTIFLMNRLEPMTSDSKAVQMARGHFRRRGWTTRGYKMGHLIQFLIPLHQPSTINHL